MRQRAKTKPHFEVFYDDKERVWRWVLRGRGTADVVACSRPGGYRTSHAAVRALSQVSDAAWRSVVEDKVFFRPIAPLPAPQRSRSSLQPVQSDATVR